MIHKLTVTLKQHTPLIHFQHSQEGATLRATEVKPKLDKFILKRLGESDDYKVDAIEYLTSKLKASRKEKTDEEIRQEAEEKYAKEPGYFQALAKGWLVGKGEHPALNYKMKIIAKGDSLIITDEYLPMYFGNIKKLEHEKKYGVIHKSISITIITRFEPIKKFINDNIEIVFSRNNFGTRKSKSYGVFTLIKKGKQESSDIIFKNNVVLNIEDATASNSASDNIKAVKQALRNKGKKKGGTNQVKHSLLLDVYNKDIFNKNYNKLNKSIINGELNIVPLGNTKTWKEYNKEIANLLDRRPSPLLLKLINKQLYVIAQDEIIEGYNNCKKLK